MCDHTVITHDSAMQGWVDLLSWLCLYPSYTRFTGLQLDWNGLLVWRSVYWPHDWRARPRLIITDV